MDALIDQPWPFSIVRPTVTTDLPVETNVRYVVISGRQDDGQRGPIGAVWLSEDGRRGGFLVNPWALWEGSEFVRGYRGALTRGWTPETIFDYWRREVWPGGSAREEEHVAGSLPLLADLVAAL
jgi:hypothetical protein